MRPPGCYAVPTWVASFCCVTPFCALMLLSVASLFDTVGASSPVLALILLCGKTTHWVLHASGVAGVNTGNFTQNNGG